MQADFGAEHIDLLRVQFTSELLRSIPAEVARKFRVLPVSQSPSQVSLVFADPSDLNAIDSLAHFLNREIYVCVADKWQIDSLIERYYGTDPPA